MSTHFGDDISPAAGGK